MSGAMIFMRLPISLYDSVSFLIDSSVTSLHFDSVYAKSASILATQGVRYKYVAHSK